LGKLLALCFANALITAMKSRDYFEAFNRALESARAPLPGHELPPEDLEILLRVVAGSGNSQGVL
jgi:hypothetical protein